MTLMGTLKNVFYIFIFLVLASFIPILMNGVSSFYNRYVEQRTQVGVLPIKGVLYDSSSSVKQLHKYFKDPAIKAILLKIECPGSATGTGHIIFNEIMTLKSEYPKPVIALVENVCASGGYYIASAADHIIASPMAIIGSVGVTTSNFFQLKEFMEQFKIKYVPITAGEYKNSTNPFTTITPEQKRMLQELLDDDYDQFVSDIAQRRNISKESAPQWANGRIFSGRQAFALHLIDELGSWSQAIKVIKNKADIETEIKWVHPPSKTGIRALLGGDSDDAADDSIFSRMVNQVFTIAETRYGTHLIH